MLQPANSWFFHRASKNFPSFPQFLRFSLICPILLLMFWKRVLLRLACVLLLLLDLRAVLVSLSHEDKAKGGNNTQLDEPFGKKERKCGRSLALKTLEIVRGGGVHSLGPLLCKSILIKKA